MIKKLPLSVAILAGFAASLAMVGCGTSSGGPGGSKAQTMSGVNENGYPGGKPVDSHSPALASSSEQLHSREQDAEKAADAKAGK